MIKDGGMYAVTSQYICVGEPYEITATIMAHNPISAQAQLDWLMANKHCMCQDCIAEYEVDYHVHVILPSEMPTYNMCIR